MVNKTKNTVQFPKNHKLWVEHTDDKDKYFITSLVNDRSKYFLWWLKSDNTIEKIATNSNPLNLERKIKNRTNEKT